MGEPDRLEREIEEILGKIENFPGPEARRARRALPRPVQDAVAKRRHAVARQISRVSISQVMLFAFLLILGSFFFREAGVLALWALYAGIILFVVSFAIMMFGSRNKLSSRQETVWRGRSVSYGAGSRRPARGRVAGKPAAPTLLVRLRRRWAGRGNRKRP
ncbi:MAG: hypothetical protein EPO16_00695 [Dehalococcoidia bacterium]|nr:MAG: hypothetical protein EPO16_00695 [Dehalococcoidia bacterium]